MTRGRRAFREDIERGLTFRFAIPSDVLAEEMLVAIVVTRGIEHEPTARNRQRVWPREPPAGQDARQRDDIVLRVAAIGAERVQFHQLARIVFVDPSLAAVQALAAGSGVLRVVEIEQHRRVVRGRAEKIAETSQRVGADRLGLVGADPQPVERLVREDIEMVVPEIDHDLLQLARAVEGAPDAGGLRLFEDQPGMLAPRLLVLGRGLHAIGRAQRPVFGEELHRIELERLEGSEAVGQCGRFGHRGGIELLGDVAVDAERLDVLDVRRARPKGQPIENVQYLTVRGAIGSNSRSAKPEKQQNHHGYPGEGRDPPFRCSCL